MKIFVVAALAALVAASTAAETPPRRSEAPPLDRLGLKTKVNVPVILCIDDKPTLGGQPSGAAYAKAAANGFRSVVTLRAANDGVDTWRERLMVESHRMRYFNLPSSGSTPDSKQVDEFLLIAREPNNHPMLVNCAFAERVAPFMMIFRIREEGWSEDKALDEAVRLGLPKNEMRKFARGYLTERPAK